MKNPLSITLIEQGAATAPQVLRGDFAASIRMAAQLGYQTVEIHVADPFSFPLEKIRALCQETGIRPSSIVTGQAYTRRNLSLTDRESSVREAAMREMFAYINIAAELSAVDGVTVGWVKGNRTPGLESEFDDLLAHQLRRMGEDALAKSQKILVECINRYECNVFNTAQELLNFIGKYALQGVYVQLDTFHMNIEEVDPAETILTCGDALGFVQFADSNRRYLGAGHIDFAPIMKALRQVHYKGSLSLECIPEADAASSATFSRARLQALMLD